MPRNRLYLCLIVIAAALFVACTPAGKTAKDLPAGDTARGAALFAQSVNGAPPCNACHIAGGSGPLLTGEALTAGAGATGLPVAEYTYQSIVKPAAYITPGYGNLMFAGYASALNAQQSADLIAYLLAPTEGPK